ncbi:DUF1684 domain-containing protein [Rurimicrobium arvi]|uniref:DUF1684 domain-containing protein n=1 Tax=Rurimicrobium arvi TaxID=2049916 RepID=A0ABP8MHR6_9BACT
MKRMIYSVLILLPLQGMAQDSYKKEIEQYRRHYKEEFIAEERSPLKGSDTAFIRFFPVNLIYRVNAHIELVPDAPEFDMETHSGKKQRYRNYAKATFTLQGKSCTLFIYQNVRIAAMPGKQNDLFLPFNDLTNYATTYGGGRYLDLSIADIKNSILTIDFNKAYNPYCAFREGYSCPIPPVENRLKIRVEAGEKSYGKP